MKKIIIAITCISILTSCGKTNVKKLGKVNRAFCNSSICRVELRDKSIIQFKKEQFNGFEEDFGLNKTLVKTEIYDYSGAIGVSIICGLVIFAPLIMPFFIASESPETTYTLI